MPNRFLQKYASEIKGFIGCYDRVIISGTLNKWGFSYGMFSYLLQRKIKAVDISKFGKGYSDRLRQNITTIAKNEEIKIQYIRNPGSFDKEKDIKKRLKQFPKEEGIVHIYSSLEICSSYEGKWDSKTRKASLKNITPRSLVYYIYFIDKMLGLCFIRIPTWIPFRIMFYFNGHNLLASKLRKNNIEYKMEDNAFTDIADFQKAQKLSNDIRAKDLHIWLDKIIGRYLPFIEETGQYYRWTIQQAEYASDTIFKDKEFLRLLYEELSVNSIHCVKPDNIATYFSRALAAHYQEEVGSKYNKHILGTTIKHFMGANSIKMYDKASVVLRVETTTNNIHEFHTYREVPKRNGEVVRQNAIMKKSIYSLYDLAKVSSAANGRYLDFISYFNCNIQGRKNLLKVAQKVYYRKRSYRGFNFFDPSDIEVLLVLSSGEFNINGFRNKSIRKKMKSKKSSSAVTRILKRLLLHGLIKKVKNSFKYYLTQLGKNAIAVLFVVKEQNIVPIMNN